MENWKTDRIIYLNRNLLKSKMYNSEDKVSVGFIDIGLAERMINKYDGDKSNLHVFIDNCNNAFTLLNLYK